MSTDILSRIVTQKKAEVTQAKERVPEDQLRKIGVLRSPQRRFFETLSRPGPAGVNIIAEIKRASPSKGEIRADLNPSLFAREYQKGGAAAISVLTDHPFFKGSFDDLIAARDGCSLPVLRKDFIVSSYQIYESAVMGADAILLIVRILEPDQLHSYMGLAEEMKLDVLVEVHTEEELKTATEAGAKLIGINSRNLKTFDTDIETVIRLGGLLREDQVAVAESGIQSREDIDRLQSAGFFNFLVGESIVRSPDPVLFIQSLLEEKNDEQ